MENPNQASSESPITVMQPRREHDFVRHYSMEDVEFYSSPQMTNFKINSYAQMGSFTVDKTVMAVAFPYFRQLLGTERNSLKVLCSNHDIALMILFAYFKQDFDVKGFLNHYYGNGTDLLSECLYMADKLGSEALLNQLGLVLIRQYHGKSQSLITVV